MAVMEGNYHIYFNTSPLSIEELCVFEALIADRLKQHERFPDTWNWIDWAPKVKTPKYEAHLDGANSDEVVRDIESFLHVAAQKLPSLKAHGWGLVDYVMEGGRLEFEFSLSNGHVDWEETDTYEDGEEWEDWEE